MPADPATAAAATMITYLTVSVILAGINCTFAVIPMLSIFSVRFWKWWCSVKYTRLLISYTQDPYRFYYTSLVIHKLLKETDDSGASKCGLSVVDPVSKKNVTLDIVYPNTFLKLQCKSDKSTKTMYIYTNSQSYNEVITDYIIYYDASDDHIKKYFQLLYFAVGMNITKCYNTFRINNNNVLVELYTSYNQVMTNIIEFKLRDRKNELTNYFKYNNITEVTDENIALIVESENMKLRQNVFKSFVIQNYHLYMAYYIKKAKEAFQISGSDSIHIPDIDNLTYDDYVLISNLLKQTESQAIVMNVISCNNLQHYCKLHAGTFGDLYALLSNRIQGPEIIGDLIDNCKNHDLRDCLTMLFIKYIEQRSRMQLGNGQDPVSLIQDAFNNSNNLLTIQMGKLNPVVITDIELELDNVVGEDALLIKRR